ncbi:MULTISPECIES: hypothetical protein [Bradyrhizobium]|uniref:hypothetical protein n=1 Tax=Bradyrhizobium TaxID=374 RepID=UPI0011786A84|nr:MULTISPECIES: hypothetical protein [Bradyrhizobium]MBP2433005.1 hypothetical protein [Bradyrhizobium elkanii]WLA89927.1 hypothetical protein QNJ96_33575 [Bradyrhizobium elkanii]
MPLTGRGEPDALKGAIERQYGEALRSIGLKADAPRDIPMRASPGIYDAAPSGREIMQELAAIRKNHGPLLVLMSPESSLECRMAWPREHFAPSALIPRS